MEIHNKKKSLFSDIKQDDIYKYLKNCINSGDLGVFPDKCKIFKNKKYLSKKKDEQFIFDFSIETFLFNDKKNPLFLIFECKNNSNDININEIEDFYFKICQFSNINIKPYLITNCYLPKAVKKYATSHYISILNFCSDLEDEQKQSKFSKENTIRNLYGSWQGNETAEELINEISNNRIFNRKIEQL